jgi:hypothetical protein
VQREIKKERERKRKETKRQRKPVFSPPLTITNPSHLATNSAFTTIRQSNHHLISLHTLITILPFFLLTVKEPIQPNNLSYWVEIVL